jgi:hypothetical protein
VNRLAVRAAANDNFCRSWLVANFRKSISVALMIGVGEGLLHHLKIADSGRGLGCGLPVLVV